MLCQAWVGVVPGMGRCCARRGWVLCQAWVGVVPGVGRCCARRG